MSVKQHLTQEEIDKLDRAFQLVLDVYEGMREEKVKCECCSSAIYSDKDKWLQKQILGAAIRRIDEVVKWGLKNNSKHKRFDPDKD